MITFLKGNLTFLNGTRLLLDVFLKTKLMIKDEIFMTKSDRIIREVHWASCRSLFWIENEMKQNEVLHENFIYFFSYLPYQFYSWSFDILWKICRIFSWYERLYRTPIRADFLFWQRRTEDPDSSTSSQSDKDYTVMQLKTDLRRAEQRVEDLQLEVGAGIGGDNELT